MTDFDEIKSSLLHDFFYWDIDLFFEFGISVYIWLECVQFYGTL